ncbi:hypothetical protein YPPY19_4697, partial [Yersinia pestis PY-19]
RFKCKNNRPPILALNFANTTAPFVGITLTILFVISASLGKVTGLISTLFSL